MATGRTIYLTEHDHKRLCTLLDVALNSSNASYRTSLSRLDSELQTARIVSSPEIPSDVVTLHSQVVVEHLDDKEQSTWVLTFPKESNISERKLSVLSPVGTALLGARKGEIVEWGTGGSGGKIRIKDILFQPEASGNYDL